MNFPWNSRKSTCFQLCNLVKFNLPLWASVSTSKGKKRWERFIWVTLDAVANKPQHLSSSAQKMSIFHRKNSPRRMFFISGWSLQTLTGRSRSLPGCWSTILQGLWHPSSWQRGKGKVEMLRHLVRKVAHSPFFCKKQSLLGGLQLGPQW